MQLNPSDYTTYIRTNGRLTKFPANKILQTVDLLLLLNSGNECERAAHSFFFLSFKVVFF